MDGETEARSCNMTSPVSTSRSVAESEIDLRFPVSTSSVLFIEQYYPHAEV